MKTSVSKSFKGDRHVGWKKTVAGKSWFLLYGTTAGDEAKAIALATALEAKWQLAKLAGATEMTQSDFDEARRLVGILPLLPEPTEAAVVREMPPMGATPQPVATIVTTSSSGSIATPRRWLYASMDEVIASTRRELKADGSNADHVINTTERILRAKDAIRDMPLDQIKRKELDDWLLDVRNLKSKINNGPLQAVTIRNIVAGVRTVLTKFVEWDWWIPPLLWERAFKGYSIKKLQTPADRKRKRKRPETHSVIEKRILWHLALPFTQAMMALADWAGHTQTEVSTLAFEEIHDDGHEMFIDRDRHKTGVHGRWWIPPEAAVVIRAMVAKTPRDPRINPKGLAFLTPRNMPLVHRADSTKKAKCDYVGNNLWRGLLYAAKHYGVRHISYKYMRKGTAQMIRDKYGKEVSRTFLAHADEDVQDENYTRASEEKVEEAVRALYPSMRAMFKPIERHEWAELSRELQGQHGTDNASGSTRAA